MLAAVLEASQPSEMQVKRAGWFCRRTLSQAACAEDSLMRVGPGQAELAAHFKQIGDAAVGRVCQVGRGRMLSTGSHRIYG